MNFRAAPQQPGDEMLAFPDMTCIPGGTVRLPRKVVKGGSHLCAPNYRRRHRPAAPPRLAALVIQRLREPTAEPPRED